MNKKIDVRELELGMYVTQLDRPWRETPFLFQGFEIRDTGEIEQLKRLCKHVFVLADLRDGRSVPRRISSVKLQRREPVRTSGELSATQTKPGGDEIHTPAARYRDQTTLGAEIQQAREIERATKVAIHDIFDDARLGRSINTGIAKRVVSHLVESVIRNPDALVCLNQLKKKDEYTAMHSLRVCVLALAFGRHLNFSVEALNLLGIGALLHDIGKMRVPVDILNKPDRLTDVEFALMKKHVPYGVEILEQSKGIPTPSIEVARLHHERYDGSGYEGGSRGDQIELFGQIGAIVDFYDAVTSDRAYHSGLSAHEALRQLYDLRGRDFDPVMAEQFIQCMGIYPIGSVVELSTGGVGVVISVNRERRLKPCVAMVLNPDKRPFDQKRTILDLMHQPDSAPVEIRTVLPSGTYGINPVEHLPVRF